MNERFKKLTIKLSQQIEEINYEFLMNNLKSEEKITNVINLVLSSHMSSLFNCMQAVAEDNEEAVKKVIEFIEDLQRYISNSAPIEKVEMIQ